MLVDRPGLIRNFNWGTDRCVITSVDGHVLSEPRSEKEFVYYMCRALPGNVTGVRSLNNSETVKDGTYKLGKYYSTINLLFTDDEGQAAVANFYEVDGL